MHPARMAAIPPSVVNEVWLELLSLSPDQLSAWIDRFRAAQPVLAGYVRAVEEGVFAEDDRGQLTLFAVWTFEAARRTGNTRREIDENTIETMLSENERLLAAVAAAPLRDIMSTASSWTEDYPNLPMLGAMLNHAMHGDLEETRRVDDFLGLLALHLKTLIDCLTLD